MVQILSILISIDLQCSPISSKKTDKISGLTK